MAVETVTSPLLSDPPPPPAEKAAQPVDEDYAKTVKAGYVESLEAFGARIDQTRAGLLAGLVAVVSALLLALGRRIQTGGRSA